MIRSVIKSLFQTHRYEPKSPHSHEPKSPHSHEPRSQWIVSSLLATTLIVAACGSSPGVTFDATGAGIVNGKPLHARATSKKEPLADSVVALVAKNADSESLCTGTILAPDIILTAAHCVENHPEKMVIVFSTTLKTAPQQVRPADRFVQNPAWGKELPTGRGDLALVHFTGGLPEGYTPVTLADNKIGLQLGTDVVMIGFGVNNGLKNAGAGILRETQTTVMSESSPTEVVTDGRKSSVCFGDSGGPAFSQENGQWVQWGVASSVTNQACNQASIHTAVMSYGSWLKQASDQLRRPSTSRAPAVHSR